MAYSTIVYSTDAIGDFGRVRATTYGTDGPDEDTEADSVTALINEGVGDAAMFFLPGQLTLTANATYHDFSLPVITEEVAITITAILIDFYGNPVVDAPISFVGTGVESWAEVYYEEHLDYGMDSTNFSNDFGEANGCFTFRDYGLDRLAGTNDMGEGNNTHIPLTPMVMVFLMLQSHVSLLLILVWMERTVPMMKVREMVNGTVTV